VARRFWVIFGAAVQVLFALTVLRLYPFLRGEGHFRSAVTLPGFASRHWLLVDGLLALQFGVSHSFLLLLRARSRIERIMPSALYGCFFCAVTCLSLFVVMELWQPAQAAIWRLQGLGARVVEVAFVLSWPALVYSLWLGGLGYQTGWTPWWAWARRQQPPRRQFKPRGAYLVLRHPVYLSLLAMIWLNPVMTVDRLALALIWTGYVFAGSYLKDQRLVHFLGDVYRQYQARVPGYPLMPWGPLGRRPFTNAAHDATPPAAEGLAATRS
jgi:methanethiol S-methyltransferase